MSPSAERGDSAKGRGGGRRRRSARSGKAANENRQAAAPETGRRSRGPAARPRIRLDRLRGGDAIALVAAILLFVLMFFGWWEVGIGSEPGTLVAINVFDRGQDAWQALEVIPLFLMLAIVVAVGAALLRVLGSDWKPAIPPGAAVFLLGLLAALLILVRMISPPELAPSSLAGAEFPISLQLPIFLALVAALGIAYGGRRAMSDEGTSFAGIAKRLESSRPARAKSAAGAKPSGRAKP